MFSCHRVAGYAGAERGWTRAISQQELAVRHVNVKMHNFSLWNDPVTKAEDWDCIGLYLKTGAHAYSAFKLKAASVQHHIQINGSHYPLLTYFKGNLRNLLGKSRRVCYSLVSCGVL